MINMLLDSLPDRVLGFLSLDYSGLILALLLLLIAWLLLRRKPSALWRWLLRAVVLSAVILAIGAISHLVRVARVDAEYPPPGKIVDVGGFDMHVLAEGPKDGSANGPAVVWFAGAHFGGLGMWAHHKAVRNEVRSILVDRPGTGWSETGPFPVTTASEAEDVMRALEAAGEKGPFIWTGHSFGGLLAANIARRYPDKTAALVLLDPTPPDVLFYGADKKGLASWYLQSYKQGLQRIFGFYRIPEAPAAIAAAEAANKSDPNENTWPDYYFDGQAFAVELARETHAGSSFAGGSALKELSAHGLVERAWDTVVYDGELGDMPLYLVAPGDEDPTTLPYAESIVGPGPEARRFASFLAAARERFMQASSNSKRVYAPAGTGHNFPNEKPEFITETMLRVVRDVSGNTGIDDATYATLTTQWPGEYGGLPPLDQATPATVEAAYRRAIREKRAEIQAIAGNPEPPSFENTILTLESSGLALRRIDPILRVFISTLSDDEYRAVAARLAPLAPELDDEIAHNSKLYQRVAAVYAGLPDSASSAAARRLVAVVHDNLRAQGADLSGPDKTRLSAINGKLAELSTKFGQNATADENSLVVFIDSESGMSGMNEAEIAAAKATAEARGKPEAWAIPIARPTVWPFLTKADDRSLREQVWRLWSTRGGNPGEHDNRPVMTEILQLRGEKARLLGFDNFAEYQTSNRMIGTPQRAMDLMNSMWQVLLPITERDMAELQAIAAAEGADFELQPWDRLYYAEKYRQQKYSLDGDAVKPYLSLDNVVNAMFWAAGETFGFQFRELDDVAVISPDIRVFEVSLKGNLLGVLWVDLFQRSGKGPASWASQYRSAENFRGPVLPLVALHSAVTPPAGPDDPVLVPWERANVIFHEFGHALHMLSNGAAYPSLGPLSAPWDFIEVPSLLNERWLLNRTTLKRFARHFETGEPMPDELIERIERVAQYDRVFSASLNFLGTAIVDMELHLRADGREMDAMAVEQEILQELQLPQAIDLTLYVPHAFHTFTEQYAAGVYTYLWSDVIAADIAEVFLQAPDGFFDAEVGQKYWTTILQAANTVPATEAFQKFRGREQADPAALMRRFGLDQP
jgi:peptidyl-dipeptidase Dcp